MKFILLVLFVMTPLSAREKKINYKYKKYEKFDFEVFNISGDKSSPGDISVSNRLRNKFKNKIPRRTDFIPEMKASVDSVL